MTRLRIIPCTVKALGYSLLLVSLFFNGFSLKAQEESKIPKSANIKLGERIFYGLVPIGGEEVSCVSCHSFSTGDSIDWNPSVWEISDKYSELDIADLKSVIEEPDGKMLEVVHKGYKLSDEQLIHLYGYLLSLSDGEANSSLSWNKLLLFIFVGLLMALALIDLIFTRKIKYRAIHIVIILCGIAWHGKVITEEAQSLGRSQDYRPDQPVKFSHKVHVGDNKLDCLYCHYNADDGKSAGIPGPDLCMNCHMIVREGTNSGKFEIGKVVKHFEDGIPIEWVRIHNLPDHVYFNHSQHVKVGGLDCVECHGQVDEMHIMKQENDLSMGWCINCHRETNVQFEDNDYYKTFEAYHKDLAQGVRDSIKAVDIGANDCMRCHH